MTPSDILEEALALSAEDRAASEAEAAWRSDVRTRLRELDEGAVAAMHWSEVRARLTDRLGR